jgi:Fe-S cluster assembly protein SufD
VFTGKVVVRVDAQQTHSEQSNHNLLLSDDAVAHTRPQLEIYADDVSCAHGATVGSIDDESLFYLRQRGLSAVEARGLLMEGFARAVLDGLPEGLHALAESHVAAWLEAR